MIDKRPRGDNVVVTFRVPAEATARSAMVAGEFNGWSPTDTPMTPADGGGFTAEIELRPGRTYRFRYLLDDERWENDWAADSYVANEYGGDDSVIDLTATTEPSTLAGGTEASQSRRSEPN